MLYRVVSSLTGPKYTKMFPFLFISHACLASLGYALKLKSYDEAPRAQCLFRVLHLDFHSINSWGYFMGY